MTEITNIVIGAVTFKGHVVNKPKRPNIVEHAIPGRTKGGIIQHMGHSSKRFLIVGRLYGANKETDKDTLEGYRNNAVSIKYEDSETGGQIDVLVLDVNIPRDGEHRAYYECTIELVEYDNT